MKNIKIKIFILCIIINLPVLIINDCYAKTFKGVENLEKVRCRDFIFLHKKIDRVYAKIDGQYFVYENNLAEIEFPIGDLKRVLNDLIEEGSVMSKELIDKIGSLRKDKICFEDFSEDYHGALELILGELLEYGQFILKEKETNQYPQSIWIGYYGMTEGIMGGQKGRLFFLPSGKIFYQIIDINI
jgi:hypothetical protein